MKPGRASSRPAVLLAASLALLIAGCSAASASRDGAPDGAPMPDAVPSAAPAEGGQSVVDGRKIARVATIDVVVKDVEDAAAALRSIALSTGGIISAESLYLPKDPAATADGYSTVVVSVPASRLDQALAAIAGIGEVRQRSIESTDVTDAVVDTESRIKTLKESIARLQTLMSKAGSVSAIAEVEAQLTQRESDLEAMLASLNSLNHRVEMAPITVTLRTPETVGPEAPNGFLAGLQAGWDSLVSVARVGLTVLGVLLPYLLIAALIAVPLLLWRRRTHSTRPRVPDAGRLGQTAAAAPAADDGEPETARTSQ